VRFWQLWVILSALFNRNCNNILKRSISSTLDPLIKHVNLVFSSSNSKRNYVHVGYNFFKKVSRYVKKIVKYKKIMKTNLLCHHVLIKYNHFFYHYLHALCRFNTLISLLLNYLAHLCHVPSIITANRKIHLTLNKLFRAS
jgi:hypothetical protein